MNINYEEYNPILLSVLEQSSKNKKPNTKKAANPQNMNIQVNIFQFKRIQQSNMDDLSNSQLKKAVKLQFSRRCGHFQQILAQMGQDFITRYSAKAQPHPEFFKEDAAFSHQQFTLYADQCVQAMQKFAFMETPATVLSKLITSLLKVNEYLAKQLYHQLKALLPEHHSLITETLCSRCSKLRQNQKVRAMREELNLDKTDILVSNVLHQSAIRKGQIYDVEEPLQQQLQNFQSLNQEQVRKRLGKLQTDHDSRRQEMSVCIQELARANQRVMGYSKAIEKKGKDQSKFDIKEFSFQISRHFYHNISSLDQKIKLLKQGLSPMIDSYSQTQSSYILLSSHQQTVNQNAIQISRLSSHVHDLQSHLIIEQRKNQQIANTCSLLQIKIRQTQAQREQLKLSQKVAKSQLNNTLFQYQNKNQNLEKIVKKLKTANKLKDFELIEQFQNQAHRQRTSKLLSNSEIDLQESLANQEMRPKQQKKHLKVHSSSEKSKYRQTFLNSRLLQKINSIQEQNIGKLSFINELTQSIHKVYSQVKQQNRDRLKIQRILDQSIISNNICSNKQPINKGKVGRERISLINIQLKHIRDSFDVKGLPSKKNINDKNSQTYQALSKFNKKAFNKAEKKASKLQKLSSLKTKQNIIFPQREKAKHLQMTQVQSKQYPEYDAQESKKKIQLVKSKADVCFQQKNVPNELLKQNARDLDLFKNTSKHRNLSQQKSLQQNAQIKKVRRSIEKLKTKESSLFFAEDNQIFFSLNSQLFSKKKYTIHKPETHKAILSLQQINYSTYFYSLMANLHLKSPVAYINLKKMLSVIPVQGSQEDGVKNSLNALIYNHRKCKSGGAICSHLQNFLQKVKKL